MKRRKNGGKKYGSYIRKNIQKKQKNWRDVSHINCQRYVLKDTDYFVRFHIGIRIGKQYCLVIPPMTKEKQREGFLELL